MKFPGSFFLNDVVNWNWAIEASFYCVCLWKSNPLLQKFELLLQMVLAVRDKLNQIRQAQRDVDSACVQLLPILSNLKSRFVVDDLNLVVAKDTGKFSIVLVIKKKKKIAVIDWVAYYLTLEALTLTLKFHSLDRIVKFSKFKSCEHVSGHSTL